MSSASRRNSSTSRKRNKASVCGGRLGVGTFVEILSYNCKKKATQINEINNTIINSAKKKTKERKKKGVIYFFYSEY